MCVFEQFQLAPHLSALSEEAQMPLHHTQLPVVLLQASGVESRAQGSDGTDRVRTLPRVTPLKPPDRKRWPSQVVMARDTERFTGSPIAESGRFFLEKNFRWLGNARLTESESAKNYRLIPGCIQVLQLIWYRDTELL